MGFLDKAMESYDSYLSSLREKGEPKVDEKIAALVYIAEPRFLEVMSALFSKSGSKSISSDDMEYAYYTMRRAGLIKENDSITIDEFRRLAEFVSSEDIADSQSSLKFKLMATALAEGLSPVQFVLFQQYIYSPLAKMRMYSQRHSPEFIAGLRKEGKYMITSRVSPADVYVCLRKLDNQEQAIEMLQELNCGDDRRGRIIDSYLEEDRDAFCLELEKGHVNLSSFKGLCLVDEYLETLDNEPKIGVATKLIRWILRLFNTGRTENEASEQDLVEQLKVSVGDIDTLGKLDVSNLETHEFEWLIGKLKPIQKICYKDFTGIMDYMKTISPAEQEVFQEVLDRQEGQVFCKYFMSRYQGTTTETTDKGQIFTLDYSALGYISEAEFTTLKVHSEEKDSYYEGSKTFAEEESQVATSYEKTTLLYEFLCNENMIDHSPENYNAFLYRFTARRREDTTPESIIPIYIKEQTDIRKPEEREKARTSRLSYFIGRVIYKVKEYKGESASTGFASHEAPKYENEVWKKTLVRFFDTGVGTLSKSELKKIEKRAAEYANEEKAGRDQFKLRANNRCKVIFEQK